MKGKKCIKFLTFFITLVLSFAIFSKDTSAISYTSNLNYIKTLSSPSWTKQVRLNNDSWTTVNRSAPMLTGDPVNLWTSYIGSVSTDSSYDIVKDHLYEFSATVWTRMDDNSPIGFIHEVSDSDNFTLVSFDMVGDEIDSAENWRQCNYTDDLGVLRQFQCYYTFYPNQSKTYRFLLKAKKSGNFPIVLNGTNSYLFEYEHSVATTTSPLIFFVPYRSIYEYEYSNISESVEEMNEKDDEDRSNIESQTSDTDSAANEQGDEATETGTSLFGAFTQLLTALTNVNGNSCTLPAMQVYTLNLGSMNLCQYDIPPQIMALVSIGMVFIIIPLGINLVKRMISLYKEITG